ncbi:MAG TPA: SMP-30/gluconolactonase/LRE family protein [Bryobacteraceae bacterium]|nr:SMP-30/gluconolactonase/LRE family protein [Bryobacteraceae bacterium]
MKLTAALTVLLGMVGVTIAFSQASDPSVNKQPPSVQAPQDPKEPEVLATCKVPPPARGGARGGGGQGRGRGPAEPAGARDYTVTAIPGVIAADAKWTVVWEASGNNSDGIIGAKDGGILIAQNNNGNIVHLDKDGKASVAYSGLNTSGAVSMDKKGALFVNQRGLRASIVELAPKRQTLADKYNGDSLDCIGGVLNDLSADSKGGAYFTMGGLYYASPKGVVTKYGDVSGTNGIILSPDEKTLYVTRVKQLGPDQTQPVLTAFDVQKDGSLTNQRDFATLEAGGDGSAVDSTGRIYVTISKPGVQVIGTDGKSLGVIPTPRGVISVAFSGTDKKTLYAVGWDPVQQHDWIMTIPMIAQGYKGRAK